MQNSNFLFTFLVQSIGERGCCRLVDDPSDFEAGDLDLTVRAVASEDTTLLVNTPSGLLKVAELGAGQIVGEIAILVDIPRTATVEAQDELVALKISKDNFLRLLNSSSQVGIEIIRVLASRLENTTNQLREAIAKIPK